MPPQSSKFRAFFKALLLVEVFYLSASFFIPQIPGWKMFASFHHIDFKLIDSEGRAIDYRPFLPTVTYQLSKPTALKLAQFICLKSANKKMTLIISEDEKYFSQGLKCDFQKT